MNLSTKFGFNVLNATSRDNKVCHTMIFSPSDFCEFCLQVDPIRLGAGKFGCPICQKIFAKSYNCKVHIRAHTGVRPFQCQECPKTFLTLQNLQNHSNSVHCIMKNY